jgi:ATP-dependent RNA helicase RhlE
LAAFSDLGLIEPIRRAIRAESYATPTPIQAQMIPHLLPGRDLLGCAETGTGKTAAFALPILLRLATDREPAGQKGLPRSGPDPDARARRPDRGQLR